MRFGLMCLFKILQMGEDWLPLDAQKVYGLGLGMIQNVGTSWMGSHLG